MDYKELNVWKLSHSFTLEVYKITKEFPKEEKYGLISQIRRAASSIPMNIAEGKGCLHRKEYLRYVGIARASANEVEYQLILSKDLSYITDNKYITLMKNIKVIIKMLNGLIKSLKIED